MACGFRDTKIFNTLGSFIKDKGLNWSKCVRLIREVTPSVSWAAVLASKTLPDKLKSVLDKSVKTVKHIKSRPLPRSH
ncbi:Zinc finger BED domain-containing protein 5 [Trichinella pseudospiralis]|uniref:Zinc finger BED domain-containing protein 5 n=1 Tax=Trichinella pseudospiralis TaxID=6337 RepID=A0A0V1FPE8_TRIPS|nr:Zinc finger BED domain-containing protein 5 [Trichinella pseudospiralis]KRY87713.1 Zinc finger BED domain-containing protein 5 [Trichinella pseudospiralis]